MCKMLHKLHKHADGKPSNTVILLARFDKMMHSAHL